MGIKWVIGALVLLVVLLVIMIYNRLVSLRQARFNAFSNIDVQLKLRFDLVPQLVNTVKGYAKHEKEVFQNITEMRTQVMKAHDIQERAAAESALSNALMTLFAVAENYPDLKADKNFRDLQMELSDVENKIAAARRFFNNATAEYNAAIQHFPAVLLADMFGFKKEEFFNIPEDSRESHEKPPPVTFE
jgi:LemA protein